MLLTVEKHPGPWTKYIQRVINGKQPKKKHAFKEENEHNFNQPFENSLDWP